VPAVLVVAGGEGMGPVEKTCSAIARASGASLQLVVVTGRNAKLAERLRLRQWPEGMHVAVQVSSLYLAECSKAVHKPDQAERPVSCPYLAECFKAVDMPDEAQEPAPCLPFTNKLGCCHALQGFVHNMEEWMHACDVIITKAGPGTIAESFICGLPVLLNGFIPGQEEEGNIEYVLEHQV
jgi:UDP-N-acetylglucosamine:LPS N-acetylglucosamine transferase